MFLELLILLNFFPFSIFSRVTRAEYTPLNYVNEGVILFIIGFLHNCIRIILITLNFLVVKVYQDEREKHESKLVGLRNGVDEAQSELTIAQVILKEMYFR